MSTPGSAVAASPSLVLCLGAGGILGTFNRAGVLSPADVHVAVRLCRLGGEADEAVALALALAVRAPRFGHVLVDLATASADLDLESTAGGPGELPWPHTTRWLTALAASPLVAVGEGPASGPPLRLIGSSLYLARYWEEERFVASALAQMAGGEGPAVLAGVLDEGLGRLFPSSADGEQAEAARTALSRHLAVVAGGPGTGKTTTIARILALLEEQSEAAGQAPPLVALAAPTGKAAARMAESLRYEAEMMPIGESVRQRLAEVGAFTLHRLLGRHPGSAHRFAHDRHNRLPHEVVVVDETSMMSLSLMASLLAAVRPEARLVLVGDPEQLASVEAGAVLGDIVNPSRDALVSPPPPIATSTCLLKTNHRFGGELAQLAEGVRLGDTGAVIELLRHRRNGAGSVGAVRWADVDLAGAPEEVLQPLKELVVTAGAEIAAAAAAGDGAAALAAAGRSRLLCAHRDGPEGVSTWNAQVEQWLAQQAFTGPGESGGQVSQWYLGRPVLVTVNDYSVGLFNGDLGVTVMRPDGGLAVAFHRGSGLVYLSPSRLSAVETAYAVTAHRAQGSEFEDVAVLLPAPGSRALTRELLYTAVTRARQGLLLVGSEASVVAAVERPVARASGLRQRLWGG